MSGFGTLLRKELTEAWRTYRLPIVGVLFAVFGLISPLLTRYLPDIIDAFAPPGVEVTIPVPGVGDVLDQLLKNVLQFGALAGVLLAMGSVATEKERGTAAFLLVKPVSRSAFLAAKLATTALVLGLGATVAVAGAFVYTAILFEMPNALGWIVMAGIVWLSILAYASLTFLGSVLTRTSLGAAGIGFAGLIVLAIGSMVPPLTEWLPGGLTAVAKAAALGTMPPDLEPLRPVLATVGIVGLAIAASWASFRHQEL